MPSFKSALAYDDIRQLLDRALESPKGIRITYNTHNQAINERNRCNTFRSADRKSTSAAYTDPGQAVSKYDSLVLTIPKEGEPDDTVLTIAKRVLPEKIEEII